MLAPEKKTFWWCWRRFCPFQKIWRTSAEVWDDPYITNHLLCLLYNYMTCQHYKFHNNKMTVLPPPWFLWNHTEPPYLPSPPIPEVKAVTSLQLCHLFIGKAQATDPCGLTAGVESWRHHPNVHPKRREPPKTMGKIGFPGAGVQKILCASQQVGKNCVIFFGGRWNLRKYFRKDHEEKDKKSIYI